VIQPVVCLAHTMERMHFAVSAFKRRLPWSCCSPRFVLLRSVNQPVGCLAHADS
jgi:hypothetical protein